MRRLAYELFSNGTDPAASPEVPRCDRQKRIGTHTLDMRNTPAEQYALHLLDAIALVDPPTQGEERSHSPRPTLDDKRQCA
jgi:hypothetical protein